MITVDGIGASHGLIDHITTLNALPWRTVPYSIGWELSARERAAITVSPPAPGVRSWPPRATPATPATPESRNSPPCCATDPGGDQLAYLAASIACELCWLRLLCLDGPLTTAEPKTLRYRPLPTAARIIHGQRRRKIRIPATWPWAQQLANYLLAALALPPPTQC